MLKNAPPNKEDLLKLETSYRKSLVRLKVAQRRTTTRRQDQQ